MSTMSGSRAAAKHMFSDCSKACDKAMNTTGARSRSTSALAVAARIGLCQAPAHAQVAATSDGTLNAHDAHGKPENTKATAHTRRHELGVSVLGGVAQLASLKTATEVPMSVAIVETCSLS